MAKDYALEMLKEAHDFKLRLADLDPEAFSFEKVFANDLQRTPYAQNVEESNNEAEIDEAIWDDAEEVAGEVAQKFSKKTPTKKYSDLDDFLTNGIEKGKSTFFDFGELSPQAVERIKNDTGVDLKGYVHTLQGYGIMHGENRHSSPAETYSGQIPITREDWKLADKIVNEFDKVEKSPKKNLLNNEVLIFQKQIGDEIYYVAEIRTGRKKLVSATMYKHKAKKEGDHTNLKSLKGLQFTSDNALVPSPNYGQSQNFSENQEENASKYDFSLSNEEASEKERSIVPPSERFDPNNANWNFSLVNENTEGVNLDVADENRRGKTLSVLLDDAKEMHADGVSMSTIFKETGWELVDVGKDNPEWIYDIDEGEVEFPVGLELNTPIPLKHYIENKKLFEVCPFLNDIKVEFKEFPNNVHGFYDPAEKTIFLNKNLDIDNAVKSLLHETQHAIDETNYLGGGPQLLLKIITEAKRAKANADETYQSAEAREASKKFYDFVTDTYKLTYEDINGYWPELENLAYEKYQSLTAEVMARNAEKRHYIDRKHTPISISEDANVKTKIYISEPIWKKIVDLWDTMNDALNHGTRQKSQNSSSNRVYKTRREAVRRSPNSFSRRTTQAREGNEPEIERGSNRGDKYSPVRVQTQNSYSYSLVSEETSEKERSIVPPSERFDPNNANWNFSLEETDEPLTEREQKNIEAFKRNIKNGSARLDISQNKAYKESGVNCDRIIVRKSVMEEAEKLGIDTDKISYELLRPTAIIPQNKLIKHTRILTNLTGKQDRIVCFQGAINKENFVVLEDILGYREEKTNEILKDAQYINKKKARLLVRGGSQEPTHIDKPNELSERDRLLRNHANYTGDQTDAIVQPNEPSERDRHLRERHLKTGASVRPDEPSFKNVASEYSRPSQAIYSENLEKAMDTADKVFEGKKDKWVSSTIKPYADVDENGRIVMFKNFYKSKHKDMPYKNKPDIDNSTSGSSINSNEEDALPSIVNVSKRNDPSRRKNFSGVSSDKEHLLDESSENNSENQDNNTSKYDFSLSDEEIDEKHASLYERYKNGDNSAYEEAVRLVAEEGEQIDSYNNGTYQSGKLFTVGTPSELLKSKGIPEKKILMTEGVLKKIRKHRLSDEQIKKIPNSINSPIGIFSYPQNENVFDILVEFHTTDGKPIIVSLEVNKNRQGFGEITDLLTAHPKESFGRIINWAKKGRCIYWDKQKGRKLLQDTSPANRERYETELAPFLPSQSENTWENQEENAKYSKSFAENVESAALGDENGKYREGANEFYVKQSGFTLSEVQEFYNSADAKFRTASVLIDKFQQNSLQLLVDGGLVSKESAKEMAKNFGYVSFRRLMEFSNSEAGFFNSSYLTIAKRFAIFQEIWI